MMALQASEVRERARACCNNPKLLITYLWFSTVICGIMYALAAIVAAVNDNGDGISSAKSLAFVGIWAMLLIGALSVGGTLVMRYYQTPLAVGFFIGVLVMMSFQMFSLALLFAGAAYLARQDRDELHNSNASVYSNDVASVFSFIMSGLYLAFACVIIKHRNLVIKDGINVEAGVSPDKTQLPSIAVPAQVIRTDLEAGKTLAPPVSV